MKILLDTSVLVAAMVEAHPKDVIAGVNEAIVLEDYPDYHKGPCVLVLQKAGGARSPKGFVHQICKTPTGKSLFFLAHFAGC